MIEEIDYGKLVRLMECKDYDYIVMLLTPWHFFSFAAALDKVQNEKGISLHGVVLLIRNKNGSYALDESYFSDMEAECYYYTQYRNPMQMLECEMRLTKYCLTYRGENKLTDFYVFSQMSSNFLLMSLCDGIYKDRNVKSIICDEGVGSYLLDQNAVNKNIKNPEGSMLKQIKVNYESLFLFPKVTKKLRKHNGVYDLMLLKEEEGILQRNDDLVGYFKKAIKRYSDDHSWNLSMISSQYVLINTQPLDSTYCEDEKIIMDMWAGVVEFYKSKGFEVWVKTHPREKNTDKYKKIGMNILECGDAAQEVLLLKMRKPAYLISIFSTTLITAKLLNDVDGVCLARIVSGMSGISQFFKNELREFEKKFAHLTRVIKSINDLPD